MGANTTYRVKYLTYAEGVIDISAVTQDEAVEKVRKLPDVILVTDVIDSWQPRKEVSWDVV